MRAAVESWDVLESEGEGGIVLICTGDESYPLLGGHPVTLCEWRRNRDGGRRCAMLGDCLGTLTQLVRRLRRG
ncbi:hypothetical protein FA95DRAFT_1563123, partial [Auriscalpium vulgare]